MGETGTTEAGPRAEADQPAVKRGVGRFVKALGPAFIVASVVLGPGSILASSRVGANYGFGMIWVLVVVGVLMAGMVAMSARLGVVLKGSMCDELAARLGRPFAFLVGLTIFFVAAGFQFGNNLGVLAALEPLLASVSAGGGAAEDASGWSQYLTPSNGIIVALNVLIMAFLFGFRKLYKPIEKMMMMLVGLMIVAFFGNLIYMLASGGAELRSPENPPTIASPEFVAVLALIGTTLSIAGAFYQSYMVREKGWGLDEVREGTIDSIAGITVLGLISLVVMITAALSFYGREGIDLNSLADVAMALEPLFGPAAVYLFSLGIFAGAFSSFLVNAMIGGAMLSDGLGMGGTMDRLSTKLFTTLGLLVGMVVAVFVPSEDRVGLIVFAQAMIVIGFPLLAISMLYLATRKDLPDGYRVPMWMKVIGGAGLLVVLLSAMRVAYSVYERIADWLNATGGA